MKKNLKIKKEDFLTDEMMKSFFLDQGRVVKPTILKEQSLISIKKRSTNVKYGLKSMYAL